MQNDTRSHPAAGVVCFVMDDWECTPQEKLLPAVSVQGRSAGGGGGGGGEKKKKKREKKKKKTPKNKIKKPPKKKKKKK